MSPPSYSSDQMCKINFSPLRSPSPRKRFAGHERNQSEAIQRPRRISVASNSVMVQHAKRASIYVSDASILLQQRNPIASPVSPTDSSMASPTSESAEVTDHYAILELTPMATTDEIRAAYRRLRSVYFANDAKKYRALQAGFDCLMDSEARQAYDATYQPAAAAAAAAPTSLSSIDEMLDQGKHWRKDSAHGDDPAVIPEEEEEEEEEQEVRTDDPNWGLKRFQPVFESALGSVPYCSYVPLPTYSLPACRAPKYVGQFAVNAWPN